MNGKKWTYYSQYNKKPALIEAGFLLIFEIKNQMLFIYWCLFTDIQFFQEA